MVTGDTFIWNRNTLNTSALQTTPFLSGIYYVSSTATSGTGIPNNDSMRGLPFMSGRTCVIDSLSAEITVAGSVGALLRFGLYSYNMQTNALTLIADAGTVSAEVAAVVTVPTVAPVSYGQILFPVTVVQGAPVTGPTLRLASSINAVLGTPFPGTALPSNLSGIQLSGITGALPTTITNVASAGTPLPRVAMKAS